MPNYTPQSLVNDYKSLEFKDRFENIEVERMKIEHKQKWKEWSFVIPSLNFKEKWNVKIIPIFGGAMARFLVEYNDKSCSVYLDVYDLLGYMEKPYWEIYCNQTGELERFYMEETKELLNKIEEILEK